MMNIELFIEKIISVLVTNNIQYNVKDVGHIVQNPLKHEYILYATKDIIIDLCDNNACINIQFNKVNNIYYVKEMTLSIIDKEYGYKHCKLYNKDKPKLNHLALNSELNENILDSILNYINGILSYKNSYSIIEAIWSKSITRTSYKKKYPWFTLDTLKVIDKKELDSIKEKYNVFDVEYGLKFFYN